MADVRLDCSPLSYPNKCVVPHKGKQDCESSYFKTTAAIDSFFLSNELSLNCSNQNDLQRRTHVFLCEDKDTPLVKCNNDDVTLIATNPTIFSTLKSDDPNLFEPSNDSDTLNCDLDCVNVSQISNMKITAGSGNEKNCSGFSDFDWCDIAAIANDSLKDFKAKKSKSDLCVDVDLSDLLSSLEVKSPAASICNGKVSKTLVTEDNDFTLNFLDELSSNLNERKTSPRKINSTINSKFDIYPSVSSFNEAKKTEKNLSDWLSSLDIEDSSDVPCNATEIKSSTNNSFNTADLLTNVNGNSEHPKFERLGSSGDEGYHSGSPVESITNLHAAHDSETYSSASSFDDTSSKKFSFFDSSPESLLDFDSVLEHANLSLPKYGLKSKDISDFACQDAVVNSNIPPERNFCTSLDFEPRPNIDLSACIKKPATIVEDFQNVKISSIISDSREVNPEVTDVEATTIEPSLPILLVTQFTPSTCKNRNRSLFGKALACRPKKQIKHEKQLSSIKKGLFLDSFLCPKDVATTIFHPKQDPVKYFDRSILSFPGRRCFGATSDLFTQIQ